MKPLMLPILLVVFFSSFLPLAFGQVVCVGNGFEPGTMRNGRPVSYRKLGDKKAAKKYAALCSRRASSRAVDMSIFDELLRGIDRNFSLCEQVDNQILGDTYLLPFGREIRLGAKKLEETIKESDYCFSSSGTRETNGKYLLAMSVRSDHYTCNKAPSKVDKFVIAARTVSKGISFLAKIKFQELGILNCTVEYDKKSRIKFASCTDSRGRAVRLSKGSDCTANPTRNPKDGFVKGHWGFLNEEALHYSCAQAKPGEDSEVLFSITANCDNLINAGFRQVFLNLTHVVDSDSRTIIENPPSDIEIRNMSALLRSQGISPILVPDFIVRKNGENVDGYEFFEALATDTTFMNDLSTRALRFAEVSERFSIPYFAPVMEMDKMLAGFSRANSWSQQILPSLRDRFSGKLLWIAGTPDIDVSADPSGYDIFGFNTSPLRDQDLQTYRDWVGRGVTSLKSICSSKGVASCFITASGVWGDTLQSDFWKTNYSEVFKVSTDYTSANGLGGLVIFDGNGSRGELVLKQYPDVLTFLSQFFAAH